MTITLRTVNATIGQIEAMLRSGSTVQEVAEFYSEPAVNVYGVQRAMKAAEQTPVPVTPVAGTGAGVATSASRQAPSAAPALTVDALVAAAARSTSKRTQALGVRLHDTATALRERLTEERAAAEKAEKQRAEREAAAAEVERLERQLREAKAKLRPARQGGGSPLRRKASPGAPQGSYPCRKSCDRVFGYPGPRGNHEKSCGGGA